MFESASPICKTIAKGYPSSSNCRLRIEKSVAFNLLLLTAPFYGILVNGYQYGVQDHDLLIPEIIRLSDPSYFPNDYFFDDPSGEYTLWMPVMAFLARRCPLDVACLVGYVVSHYLLYWAVYHISLNLFRSRSAALFALFLLLVQRQVGGTSMDTREIFFGTRTPSIACALSAVLFLITDRIKLAAFFSGVSFLLHPLIAIPVVMAFLVRVTTLVVLRNWKKSLQGLAVLASITMPLFYKVFMGQAVDRSGLSLTAGLELQHLEILQHRCSYLFMRNWSLVSVLSCVSYAVLLGGILIGRLRTKRLRRCELRVCEVLLICLCLSGVGFVFTEWLPKWLILQMQLGRSFYLIVYLGTVYSGYVLLRWAMAIHPAGSDNALKDPRSPKAVAPASAGAGHWRASDVLLGTLAVGILIGMHLTVSAHVAANMLILIVFAGLQNKRAGRSWRSGVFLVVECVLLGVMLYLTLLEGTRLVSSLEGYFIWIHDTWIMIGAVAGSLLNGALSLVVFGNKQGFKSRFAYGTILVTNASLVSLIVFTSPQVHLPPARPENPLTDVATWCERNTPKDAVFIVHPQARHFRIYSNRGIVGSAKDGAKAAFSKRFAYEWSSRMEQLWNYDSITDGKCVELAGRYGASHVITLKDHELRFPLVYRNDRLNVYRIVTGGHGGTKAELDAAIRLDPENAVAYDARGSAAYNRGEFDKAIADWTEAIRLNPEVADLHDNRGLAYVRNGKYDRAIADFTEAIRLDPKLATAYNNRGFVYQNMKQLDQAVADYSETIRLDPDAVMARGNRGSLHAAMGQYEKAIADFSRLIQLDPNSVPAYSFRGVAYHQLGQYDKAVADFTQAIRLDPTQPLSYSDRAAAYRALGNKQNAAEDERKARELTR